MFLSRAIMGATSSAQSLALVTESLSSSNLTGGSSHYFNTASKSGAQWSDIFTGGFTFFVWFKGSSFTDFSKLMSCADSGLTMDVSIDVRSDGTVRFVYDEGSTFAVAQTASSYDDNNWHLACGIFDGSSAIIDIDGGAEIVTDASATIPATAASVLSFGRLGDNSSNYFTGGLSFGGYSEDAFTAGERVSLYNSGTALAWGVLGSLQSKIDGYWYTANSTSLTGEELTDQAGADNLTNNNTTPYTSTGLDVRIS